MLTAHMHKNWIYGTVIEKMIARDNMYKRETTTNAEEDWCVVSLPNN